MTRSSAKAALRHSTAELGTPRRAGAVGKLEGKRSRGAAVCQGRKRASHGRREEEQASHKTERPLTR
eukprot:766751-Hanusia_phi.AAC.4